jgi:hypothetical protein
VNFARLPELLEGATSLALTAHEKIGPPFSGPKFSENNAPPGSDGESVIGKH